MAKFYKVEWTEKVSITILADNEAEAIDTILRGDFDEEQLDSVERVGYPKASELPEYQGL